MDTKIFENLLEPTFVIDENKIVHYCNETAATIADTAARKIVRNKVALDLIFKFEGEVQALQQLSSLNDASPYQELRFKTDSGHTELNSGRGDAYFKLRTRSAQLFVELCLAPYQIFSSCEKLLMRIKPVSPLIHGNIRAKSLAVMQALKI